MAKRQSLSKKKRFEVFKRDKFACQYCGKTPPDVVLECDHITPVAEGGSSEYENLITSCVECNRGKSDTPLAESECDNVAIMKLEQVAQLSAFNRMLRESIAEMDDAHAWLRKRVASAMGWQDLSDAEAKSLRVFSNKLSMDKLCEAADKTGSRKIRGNSDRWRYFCGICWNMIKNPI